MADTVLVTGGTGFIAQHCILQLLDAGYHVRATARSRGREAELVAVLTPHVASGGPLEGRFSVVATDLTSDDGWDEAVKGCTYVLHVASPIFLKVPKDENEMIVPARDGTLRVLRASNRAGVKRVVMTSSVAAIAYGTPRDHFYTEEDWTNVAAGDVDPYAKSKAVAEKAAWDYIGSAENSSGMELATILPGLVLGPVLSSHFSSSGEAVKRMMNHEVPGMPDVSFPPVDVRDVAWSHVKAMTLPAANGQRFICAASDSVPMLAIGKILEEHYASQGYKIPLRKLPKAAVRLVALFDRDLKFIIPEIGKPPHVDASKIKTQLGLEPRDLREMTLAMAETMIRYGIVKGPK
ncbi:MAG: aldehyde reductase [Acidimicrobiales bacterium]